MYIYIKVNDDGFVTSYQNTEADGFTRVYLLDTWINQFMRFPDKFRYGTVNNSTTKQLLNPGNLPDISLSDLNDKYQSVLNTNQQVTQSVTTIAQAQTENAKSQTENTQGLAQVRQAITALAVQNALSSATVEDTAKTDATTNTADTTATTKEEA